MTNRIKETISIAPRKTLVKNLLLIDGISRTGKYLLGNILDGFQRVDHYQSVSVLEHAPFLERLNLISEEAAVSFIQMAVDEHAYHMQIGRGLNFRRTDKSTLYNSFQESEYSRRMKTKDDSEAIANFKKAGHYSTFLIHEGMPNIRIFFKAYPSAKIVSIVRHPVDTIHSWYLRGWGKKETLDPRSFQPCITMGGEPIPWYAYQCVDTYAQLNQMDRVINIMASLFDMSAETVQSLTPRQKGQIIFITYEDLVEETHQTIQKMGQFLNAKPHSSMPKILKRERCPNKNIGHERGQKLDNIKKKASREAIRVLSDLIERYEEHKGNIFLANGLLTSATKEN